MQQQSDCLWSRMGWLSVDKNGKLHITKEGNGSNPVRAGLEITFSFDVGTLYYLDYQNRCADHVNAALWNIID